MVYKNLMGPVEKSSNSLKKSTLKSAVYQETPQKLKKMLRFVVFTTLLATAFAGYGSRGFGGYGGYSAGGYGGGLVTGAVQSRRSVQFYDVPSTYSNPAPLTIDLPSSVQPLNFVMRTQSSPLNVQTSHQGSPGSYAETSSVDEPHVRVHNVNRPIIQQLNEVITPYRRVRQQVNPVQEEVQSLVARGTYGGGLGYGTQGYGASGY